MYDKFICPFCKVSNLIYLGDWSDCTSPDVEAAKCGACGKLFLMGDEFNQAETLDEIIRSHYEFEEEDDDIDYEVELLKKELLSNREQLSAFLKEYAYYETGEVQ